MSQICSTLRLRDLSLAKPLAPIIGEQAERHSASGLLYDVHWQLLSYDFTGARPIPTGLPDWDHEHARPAGAKAPYFLSLEADAFC